jgi:biofilm PGA synthesis N-glycosyltransferase PgaC
VALYPVVTSMMWVSGRILFRFLEEPDRRTPEPTQWPGVTVLIPAYNEQAVIAISVQAALAADYPELEVLVLDDGSADETAAVATETAGGDPRCRVIRDPVNRGKADRLNQGFQLAQNELVVVTDADTQMHPLRSKSSSPGCSLRRRSRRSPGRRTSPIERGFCPRCRSSRWPRSSA